MFSILTVIIYLLFISMGLPDSLLGAAWPSIEENMGMAFSLGGVLSMTISLSTIFSSLFSHKLIKDLGSGRVCAISVALTAIALTGFSTVKSFWLLLLFAIPYGLGAGAIDVAVNDYVALNYSSRHMKMLHCFWGVGAALGAYIMGNAIKETQDYHAGYSIVAVIQVILTVILFSSLSIWRDGEKNIDDEKSTVGKGIKDTLFIKGVKPSLIAFFGYSAFESTAGMWACSYFAKERGFDIYEAAIWASAFYVGITVGRFIGGLLPKKAVDKHMIRAGGIVMIIGITMMLIPLGKQYSILGLFMAGLGASPIYPSMIHRSPVCFGRENSTRIVGMQMASAYAGSSVVPLLFGICADVFAAWLYPYFLLLFATVVVIMTERINSIFK
ncbi:MAG: MFS transporter [Ruminococcaceae bacterium]|nr:MFS transporter [Oscillospiraceae bacterium]